MQKCGFVSMVAGMFRRISCFGDRTVSSDSYYRDLEDTLKIDDKSLKSLENYTNNTTKDLNDFEPSSSYPDQTDSYQDRTDSNRAESKPEPKKSIAEPTVSNQEPTESNIEPKESNIEPTDSSHPEPSESVAESTESYSKLIFNKRHRRRSNLQPDYANPQPGCSSWQPECSKSRKPECSMSRQPECSKSRKPECSMSRQPECSMSRQPECSKLRKPESSMSRPVDVSFMSLAKGKFLTMNFRRKKPLVTGSLAMAKGLLDDFHYGQMQCLLEQTTMWHFNAFILENISGGRSLPMLGAHLFDIYGLISHFKLDYFKAWKLFVLVEEHYHSNNPYHNSVHATDVTQAMHCFLQQKQIRDYIQPIEVLASLLAAMAHDIDHPGVNQPFLVATSNFLAHLYQNQSVLENHHRRAAISCIIESGLLDQLQPIQEQLHGLITSLILATDITRQQEYLERFKHFQDTQTLDMQRADHRHLVLQMALKCADISNPCRPWEVSRKWSLRVCEEFFQQGDRERGLRLPVSSLCDRLNSSIPQIQTGFFKQIVNPLISEWHRFLQNDLSAQMFRNLSFNLTQWEKLLAQEVRGNARAELPDKELLTHEQEAKKAKLPDLGQKDFLLALRRRSFNPVRQICYLEHLRRYSVPLNAYNIRDSLPLSPDFQAGVDYISETSLHSDLSDEYEPHSTTSEREQLFVKSSSLSSSTPPEDSSTNPVSRVTKLVRQKTFPPVYGHRRLTPGLSLFTCNVDALYPSKSEISQKLSELSKKKLSIFFKRNTDEKKESSRLLGRGGVEKRRGSAPVGSQLLSNLAVDAARDIDQLLPRRKSMPTDTVTNAGPEKISDMKNALPQLKRRTFSGKEWVEGSERRRGSAPASEHRGSAARRCQQWLFKATRGRTPSRRSSLPVEVLLLTEVSEDSSATEDAIPPANYSEDQI